MYVGLYGRPDNPYMAAAMQGVEALGHRQEWRRPGVFTADQREAFDLVMVYGLQGRERTVRDVYAAAGVPVLVLDHAYCGDLPRIGVWWRDMAWLPRPNLRMRNPFRLEPRREGGEHVLVCGQKPGDAQHDLDGPGMVRWARETIWRLRQFTARPIDWRPHPSAPGDVEIPGAVRDRSASIEEALGDAFVLVTYNSTAGIKALAAGVPVICSPAATYAAIANTDLAAVADPRFPTASERDEWFDRLGGVLWTREELRDGSCLRFMLEEEGYRHAA